MEDMPQRARVILTTYNNLPHLRRALRGYLRQTTHDFALTVADDGSTPETGAWLKDFALEAKAAGVSVQHVWHEDRGFRRAAISNEGVRQAEDEALLILSDGDCIPPAHFVERHIAAYEPRSFHVAGAYRLTREVSEALTEADVDAGRHEILGTDRDLKALGRRRRKSFWGTWLRRRNRPKVFGLNIGIDRALFEAINGYDERFNRWGLEDSDLRDRVMRLRPRPRVKNLYLQNDVYHLWHPPNAAPRAENPLYRSQQPIRCEQGLIRG